MERLAIIGAGTMGHSIALNAAWKGFSVSLYAIDDADLQRASEGILAKLKVLNTSGLITVEERENLSAGIRIVKTITEVLEGASFVIEAIPEDIRLKKNLLTDLDGKCVPEVILASNTSGLSISALATGLRHPERLLITHFWNPAHLVPLVEVLGHDATSSQTYERTMQLLTAMDKKPVLLKKELPGMIGNRLQFALLREAQYILDNGFASREDIDNAVRYGIARRLPVTGPLQSADMGGLDVFAAICAYLFPALSSSQEVSPGLNELLEQGKFGQKTGEGYYEWSPETTAAISQAREDQLIRFLKKDKGI